jgi:DNA-binding NarL/FixJ family response regulator
MGVGTLSVRVVSPCPLLGESLTRLLGAQSEFEAAWDAVEDIEREADAGSRPDLVLVDAGWHDSPPDLGPRIQRRWPGVVMIELVRAGARGERHRPVQGAVATLGGKLDANDLAVSLRRVHERGRLRPTSVPRRRAPEEDDPEGSAVARLTERETEVLRLLVAGHPPAEMARVLGLSVNTLRAHVQNLLVKLQVHSRLEAAALARRVGLGGAPGPPAAAADRPAGRGTAATRERAARVLVADGRPLVRTALRVALDAEDGVVVVAEAADTEEAIAEAHRVRPDVVLLDAQLPPGGGVEACALIKSADLVTRVLVVSEHPDEERLLAAVEAGGDGYSEWSGGIAGLAADIRRLHAGEASIPPGMLGLLLRRLIQRGREADRAVDRFSRLSRREREILALMVEGMDNHAIARALVISPHTARTHAQNVLSKLGVHSRVEAAAVAAEFGLIERFMGAS